MLMLVVAVVVGTVLAVFASYNTVQATLNIPVYGVVILPTYIIVILPLLLGLVIAYGVHLMRTLGYKMQIGKLKGQIKDLKSELTQTRKDAHKFELESAKVKAKNGEPEDENSL